MKVIKIIHENVKRDGTFENQLGAVETDGCIRSSGLDACGCGSEGCHCSDGHWMSLILPRNEYGVVEGIRIYFDNKAEMKDFLQGLENGTSISLYGEVY